MTSAVVCNPCGKIRDWMCKACLIPGRVTALVRGFNAEWKRAIELINAEVMQSFTNFKNGTQILQVLKRDGSSSVYSSHIWNSLGTA